MLQADIESLRVYMVCAGVCKHAELPTCFLFENMVRSGCQVQPQALPAAAWSGCKGLSLMWPCRTDKACGKDRKKREVEAAALRGGAALLAWSSLKSDFDRPLDLDGLG